MAKQEQEAHLKATSFECPPGNSVLQAQGVKIWTSNGQREVARCSKTCWQSSMAFLPAAHISNGFLRRRIGLNRLEAPLAMLET